jgi:hypothetical protein
MPPDGVLGLRRHLGAAQLLALRPDAVQPGIDPAANDLPLLFTEHACHLDHGAATRRGAVDGLLVGIEGNASSIEFGQGVYDVENAASQSVDGPDHEDIEPPPHRVLEHPIERRSLVSTLGSADTLVFVGLDDYPATVFCDLDQDEPLVICCLIVTADAQVGCSANALGAHSSDHPRYGTIRNDTIYPEIVELSAWEWSLCARDLSDGPHRLGGLEPRPRLVCTPTRRMGSSVQRKRVDARPMRPCRSLESDGIEHRSVRKKSLYLAVSPDMNRTPESGQAVDRPRHR